MKTMLKYLPCRAGDIPKAYRNLLAAEREGLARCEATFLWKLTPKGERFLKA